MSVAVVIPSRLDSSRVPRKALQDLRGLPIVEHVRRRAVEAGVGPVVVATDSPEIARVVEGFGGRVCSTGPALSGTHRVAEAAASLEAGILLNVQGDQPFLDPAHVVALAELMRDAEIGTVATVLPEDAHGDPARVKVRVDGGFARDFRRDGGAGFDHLHLGLYGFTRAALLRVTSQPVGVRARAEGLEQLTWLEGGSLIRVVVVGPSAPAVDTVEQLEAARGG